MTNPITQEYNMIGATVYVNGIAFGTLENLDYRIEREQSPVFSMGSQNPKSFVKDTELKYLSLSLEALDAETIVNKLSQENIKLKKDVTKLNTELNQLKTRPELRIVGGKING